MSVRIYELAKKLNMTNKEILEKLESLNISVKSHMSSLEDEQAQWVEQQLRTSSGTQTPPVRVEETRVHSTVIRRRRRAKEGAEEEVEAKAPMAEKEPSQKTDRKKEAASLKEKAEPTEKAEAASLAAQETLAEEMPLETLKEDAEKKTKTVSKTKEDVKLKKKVTAAKIIELPPGVSVRKKAATAAAPSRPTPSDRPARKPVPVVEEAFDPTLVATLPDTAEAGDKKRKDKKGFQEDIAQDKKLSKKKLVGKRKGIYEPGDSDSDEPMPRRGGGKKVWKNTGKSAPSKGQKTQITVPKAIKRRIWVDETIVLAELAKRMGIKAADMIKTLMGLGVMATVNQTIDFDTAVLVASEFGYEVEKAAFEEEALLGQEITDLPEYMLSRPPVVTIMGHVDHGKTSLLDTIRKTNITDQEAGGITQHIGAYSVITGSGHPITFLDTPGHEAFTAMRARGAKITDIVVLVVAADDGVMPQTVEAINHSRAAEVPIIIAINKMDKPDANPERVIRELSDQGVVPEDWGGDTIFVQVSAKAETGIDQLLEMILLQSEMLELKANPDKKAVGHVVEAKLDPGRGPVATILVQEGTLEAGDPIICGIHYGRVRAMFNDKGAIMDVAGPSMPVEILGLSGVPQAGDEMISVADDKSARQISSHRAQKQRSLDLAKSNRLSLEGLFDRMQRSEVKDLNLIIRADVQGSIEALKDSLLKLSTEEVNINVVHAATGTITESDVQLATVSNAIILGFNVRPTAKVHDMASDENVDMRFYDVIYNAIKDIKDAIVGLMDSTFEERILGRADVRQVFHVPKVGTIAGSYVTDGKIERGQQIRVLREGIILYTGKIASLRRFKEDVKEVLTGYECGIGIERFNDVKVGDTIECFYMEEIKPELKE